MKVQSEKEMTIRIIATRLKRSRAENNASENFFNDVDVLIDLILGGEA
ncbi:hypothetical protein Trichorick_01413 (plasmid) [Candidatus Trichorickettsia mobilis]|uniref:Uncharacterized protein n=1 Tax=Candidatus Trichorickettsia mobilis TaxID=1346319 RepID=A0ABZ0UTY9_9RICK|nr:hypothetical protein [Candidatus Trichorickettsia mobilis]WPY01500.1 hypothetical protein Trichorick_01413 [Candidatus Trichorickettsia mobilis]